MQTKINPEALATVKNVTQVQNQHWVVTVVATAWVILENLAATPVPVTCYLAKTLALRAARSSCKYGVNNLCPASLRSGQN